MGIEMKFENLEQLISEVEKLATPLELKETDQKILKTCGTEAHKRVKSNMHRSKNVNYSGRVGSRTGKHASDNIPISGLKKKGDYVFIVVGWTKGDKSPYYYMKFEEWGTSQRPPHASFYPVVEKGFRGYTEIALKEYEKLLKKLERI